MRRFLDIFFSSIAILFFLPLLIPVMVILKLTGEHYIFYTQERIGKNEKPFKVLKFATMLKDSPNMDGANVTKRNDPRVLPFGKFLRKTKINELPQLFNIWLGQMSVVGPRPLTKDQYFNYSDEQRQYISMLTPGLTGIGSIVFRDEETIMEKSGMDYNLIHDTIIAEYKGDLENWYFNNQSVFIYIKIICYTVIAVLNPRFTITNRFTNLPTPDEPLKSLLKESK